MVKERDDIETMTQVWLRNSSGAPRNLLLVAVGGHVAAEYCQPRGRLPTLGYFK